jgi:hypothetical protein
MKSIKHVYRKSDGKKFTIADFEGDEICVREKYAFWTSKGTKHKMLKLWHNIGFYSLTKLKK